MARSRLLSPRCAPCTSTPTPASLELYTHQLHTEQNGSSATLSQVAVATIANVTHGGNSVMADMVALVDATGVTRAVNATIVTIVMNGSSTASAWNWSVTIASSGGAAVRPLQPVRIPAALINETDGEFLIALSSDENMIRLPRGGTGGQLQWGGAVTLSNMDPDPTCHELILVGGDGNSEGSLLGNTWDISSGANTVADTDRLYQAVASACGCPSVACWDARNATHLSFCPGWPVQQDYPNITNGDQLAGTSYLALGPHRGGDVSDTLYMLADAIAANGDSKRIYVAAIDTDTAAIADVGVASTPSSTPYLNYADTCCAPLVVEDGFGAGHDAVLVLNRLLTLYAFNASSLSAGPVWFAVLAGDMNDVPPDVDPPVQCAGSALGWSAEAGVLYIAWTNHTDSTWAVAGVRIV